MAEDKITMKQEIFCQEWIDTIGNGTLAALKAFDIVGKELLEIEEKDRTEEQKLSISKAYNTASVMAVEYLRKPSVTKRIDEILEERGFNDDAVRKEHYKILKQDTDLNAKMRAISDYYKLKGKYAPDKVETNVVVTGFNFVKNENRNSTDNSTTPQAGTSLGDTTEQNN